MAIELYRLVRNLPELVNVRSYIQLEYICSKGLQVLDFFEGLASRCRNNLISSLEGSERQFTPNSGPNLKRYRQ